MNEKWLSESDVVEMLRQAMGNAESNAQYCRDNGISETYAYDVLSGKKHPGPKIYEIFGLEEKRIYRGV